MDNLLSSFGVVSYISEGILIVQLQSDLYTEVIEALRTDIVFKLHSTPQKIKGLIIDVSKINLLDCMDMAVLEKMLQVATALKIPAILSGVHRHIVMTLSDMGYNIKNITSTATIEQATKALQHDTTH